MHCMYDLASTSQAVLLGAGKIDTVTDLLQNPEDILFFVLSLKSLVDIFGSWPAGMSQDFVASSLSVLSALLGISFVELFTSLRKHVNDKLRVEVLHESSIARDALAFKNRRASRAKDLRSIQEYRERIASLRTSHFRHVKLWVLLLAVLVFLIFSLLQWSSAEQTGGFWQTALPNFSKAAFIMSITYFVYATVLRHRTEKNIAEWERRHRFAKYFQISDSEYVFTLEKEWLRRLDGDSPGIPEGGESS